jgi:hypothetical protein
MKSLSKLLSQDVEAICYEDGRKVGTRGHEDARKHLGQRLAEIGCVPFSGRSFDLPYQYKGQDFCNLIGRIPGRENRLAPMLVGAHYDSVIPHPCADDNAAAVAIALQAGRLIAEKGGLERDVVIAIFDAEEPPYYLSEGMGSNRFYEDHVVGKGEIHAAVIMDLVGHDISVPAKMLELVPGIGGLLKFIPGLSKKDISVPLLSSVMFVTGSESHEDLPGVLEAIGQPSHLRVIPTLNNYIGDVSDHGVFRRNGVPYYFLSCGQWAHYHMPTDTPDRLNYDKMAAITNYVIQMMTSLDDYVLGGRTGLENIHETIELESAFMRDALGILYRPAMKWASLDEVNTRPKMDKFVRHLLSKGTAIL